MYYSYFNQKKGMENVNAREKEKQGRYERKR